MSASFALRSSLLLACVIQGSPHEDLARAEELACLGRHREARELYEKIARVHPGTSEGKLATERAAPSALLGSCALVTSGPSANRLDIVLLGDGYELEHQRAFDELAEDVPPLFERVEPFREYWAYLNFVRGVCLSAEAGVDGFGREYDTLLGGFTHGTEEGHVGIDVGRVHNVLARIPDSDGVAVVFVKLGVHGTGGGGVAVIGGRDARTTIHEWGHAFGGLGDEYSTYTHHRGVVRDGINVAAGEDPKSVPWKHWLEARHPSVGVHEGAAGQAMHAWRPTASGCIMNDGETFCPVCREELVLRIHSIVDPIEEVSPPAPPPGIREPILLWKDPVEIRVRTLKPASHDLDVRWWLEPAERYPITPPEPAAPDTRTRSRPKPQPVETDRRKRGPLREIAFPLHERQSTGLDGECRLRLSREDLEPGRYRITCRVRDTTELRGEKFPWVLRDEHGVLESERVWWLEVR